MKIGPFTSMIAETLHEEERTVAIYVRELRNASLLTTGEKGWRAPDMLPIDAVRVVIALLATDKPSRAVELVERFRTMTIREVVGDLPHEIFGGAPTLEQVLVRCIAAEPQDGLPIPDIEIRRWEKSAVVAIAGARAVFREQFSESLSAEDRKERFGKLVSCGMMPATLLNLAVLLWADRQGRPSPLDWRKGA